MKPEVKFLLTVIALLFIGYFINGYIEKKKVIIAEEERMVEYTLENFEDIRKIEFTSFEQDFSTKMWSTGAIINDNIYVSYHINSIGENNRISINYHTTRSDGRKPIEKKDKNQIRKVEDIEVIYKWR